MPIAGEIGFQFPLSPSRFRISSHEWKTVNAPHFSRNVHQRRFILRFITARVVENETQCGHEDRCFAEQKRTCSSSSFQYCEQASVSETSTGSRNAKEPRGPVIEIAFAKPDTPWRGNGVRIGCRLRRIKLRFSSTITRRVRGLDNAKLLSTESHLSTSGYILF